MRKKIEKKLVLSRETLRTLAGDHLVKVLGGSPPDTDLDSCNRTCTCKCEA